MVSIDIRHPEKNTSKDDGVEDSNKGDAQHNPEGDKGDLPGPENNSIKYYTRINMKEILSKAIPI